MLAHRVLPHPSAIRTSQPGAMYPAEHRLGQLFRPVRASQTTPEQPSDFTYQIPHPSGGLILAKVPAWLTLWSRP